jgi:predicted RND superfamily exporter protein
MNEMQNLKQTGGASDNAMMQAMKQFKTKIKNAYVLIYEREDIIDMEKFNEAMDDPNINTNKQEIAYRYEQCKLQKATSS